MADLSKLQETYNNTNIKLREAVVSVEEIEAEVAYFGPISIDEWVDFWKGSCQV